MQPLVQQCKRYSVLMSFLHWLSWTQGWYSYIYTATCFAGLTASHCCHMNDCSTVGLLLCIYRSRHQSACCISKWLHKCQWVQHCHKIAFCRHHMTVFWLDGQKGGACTAQTFQCCTKTFGHGHYIYKLYVWWAHWVQPACLPRLGQEGYHNIVDCLIDVTWPKPR